MSDGYKIRRILQEKVSKQKSRVITEYLVDWEPTFVHEKDVNADAKKCFEFSIVIKGPVQSSKDFTKGDWVVSRIHKNAQLAPSDFIIGYERLKAEYPQELITYYEGAASFA